MPEPTPAALDQAEALLEALVGIPSPPRREAAAVHALVGWLAARGFQASRDGAGSAVGTRGVGPHEMLLLGHIDTFPGDLPVRRADGRLYGRGTVDAKGPLCAFAAAAAAVSVPPQWRVTVVGAVEEESWTSRGARHLVRSRRGAAPPAAVVVGEPSRWDRVTLGYRGSVEARLRLRAPYAHSAGAASLPAERAVRLWHAIEQFCATRSQGRPDREFERYGAALRSLRTADDGAHGVATLTIGLRLPPGARLAALRRDLSATIDGLVRGWGDGAEVGCRFRGGQEAYQAPKSGPLVSAFLQAIRSDGGHPRFVVKTGTSDLTIVGPAWPETPMVVYGPGDGALDHTPDEHLDLAEYRRAVRVLTRVLEAVMRGTRESVGRGIPPSANRISLETSRTRPSPA